MPLTQVLSTFHASISQCKQLVANAHQTDPQGAAILPAIDQSQITVAELLNMFVAWETFLEETLVKLMTGEPTISGRYPIKHVSPPNEETAQAILIGTQRYFDFSNHEYVKKIAHIYFDQGYPFEPHITGITQELADLKIMRNASAHLSSTTQRSLESLAQRIHSTPRPGLSLYSLLVSVDPRSTTRYTVFEEYRLKLSVTADLIAQG